MKEDLKFRYTKTLWLRAFLPFTIPQITNVTTQRKKKETTELSTTHFSYSPVSFAKLAISKNHEEFQTTFINSVALTFHKANAHHVAPSLNKLQQKTQRKTPKIHKSKDIQLIIFLSFFKFST